MVSIEKEVDLKKKPKKSNKAKIFILCAFFICIVSGAIFELTRNTGKQGIYTNMKLDKAVKKVEKNSYSLKTVSFDYSENHKKDYVFEENIYDENHSVDLTVSLGKLPENINLLKDSSAPFEFDDVIVNIPQDMYMSKIDYTEGKCFYRFCDSENQDYIFFSQLHNRQTYRTEEYVNDECAESEDFVNFSGCKNYSKLKMNGSDIITYSFEADSADTNTHFKQTDYIIILENRSVGITFVDYSGNMQDSEDSIISSITLKEGRKIEAFEDPDFFGVKKDDAIKMAKEKGIKVEEIMYNYYDSDFYYYVPLDYVMWYRYENDNKSIFLYIRTPDNRKDYNELAKISDTVQFGNIEITIPKNYYMRVEKDDGMKISYYNLDYLNMDDFIDIYKDIDDFDSITKESLDKEIGNIEYMGEYEGIDKFEQTEIDGCKTIVYSFKGRLLGDGKSTFESTSYIIKYGDHSYSVCFRDYLGAGEGQGENHEFKEIAKTIKIKK